MSIASMSGILVATINVLYVRPNYAIPMPPAQIVKVKIGQVLARKEFSIEISVFSKHV